MPRAPRKKRENVPLSDTLEKMFKGFSPRFGSQWDIRILKEFGEVKKMLSEIKHEAYRDLERKGKVSSMTAKMRDIYSREQYIERMMNERRDEY